MVKIYTKEMVRFLKIITIQVVVSFTILPCFSQKSILDDTGNLFFGTSDYENANKGLFNYSKTIIPGRFQFFLDTAKLKAVDPITQLPILPPGKSKVIRVNNSTSGAQVDRITYEFIVTPESEMFIYEYFPVLEDPDHIKEHQPKMEITITDLNGKILDESCGYYLIYAGPDAKLRGYKSIGLVQYKEWTSEAINLSLWRGKRIRINLTVFDCQESGHFGYAYLSAYTAELNVKVKYCKGDEFATLIAPDGFVRYEWSTGAVGTKKITISKDKIDQNYTCKITSVNGCTVELPASINTEKLFINPIVNVRNVSCNGKQDGAISLEVSGGYKPYSFQWADGLAGSTPANLNGGTYKVIITDNVGCNVNISVKVEEPYLIPVKDSVSHVHCFGGNDGKIFLSSNEKGIFNARWANGSTGLTASDLQAGVYYFEFYNDTGGCTYDSTRLSQPLKLAINSKIVSNYNGYSISCFKKNDGSLEIATIGGVTPYNLEFPVKSMSNWTGSSLSIDSLYAGTYTVKVVDNNNCIVESSVFLNQPDSLSIRLTPSAFNKYHTLCYNDSSGYIKSQITGNVGEVIYSWKEKWRKKDYITPEINNIPIGYYTLSVSDANNCTTRASAVINSPQKITVSMTYKNLLFIQFIKIRTSGGAGFHKVYSKNKKYRGGWLIRTRKRIIKKESWTVRDENNCSEPFTVSFFSFKNKIREYKPKSEKKELKCP